MFSNLAICSGDPAGIGPDIIIKLASLAPLPAIILGDINVFKQRAKQLNIEIVFEEYNGQHLASSKDKIYIQHIPCPYTVRPGVANPDNAQYVLTMLDAAVAGCITKNYSAMVTAPVNKAMICQAGHDFSGHTEYIARMTETKNVTMMLACKSMRVALVTTHLPLAKVPQAISADKIEQTLTTVTSSLKNHFDIPNPKLMVAGLNPHAGEQGYLGHEEIEIIAPALNQFTDADVIGPVAADTMFSPHNCQLVDCFIAMYHDQGLAVLKYAGFGHAVNITLGLPIIRTSVDHGTAYALAGTGKANAASLQFAIEQAKLMSGMVGY